MADVTVSLGGIIKHFESLPDPRHTRNRRHLLIDVIVIVGCGVIVGCKGPTSIERWAKAKQEWLEELLELPGGIPSRDCISRILSALKPEAFQKCFGEWIAACLLSNDNDTTRTIAIDGKTMRRSHDKAAGLGPLHIVSAWASEQGIALGQLATEEKSNEITAIPELLKQIDVKGAVVTIDAMGCQKEIAQCITDQEADYVLALKENHKTLYDNVSLLLTDVQAGTLDEITSDYVETIDGDHGRIETRRYWITSDVECLGAKTSWSGLQSVGMVESRREVGDEVSIETRYFLTSMPCEASRFAQAVRGHWGVENSLHWVLDVSFSEDACRIRKGYGPQNLAVLRHMALNLLGRETRSKRGIKARRKRAGWNRRYLMRVLMG